jgi:hypothetical protein
MSDTRKITVISTSVLKQGDTWTLYDVVATDERGEPITKTLKTFEANLPTGQLIEVEVEKNSDPRYDEYMVRLPGSKRGGGGKGIGASVDLIREQVNSLQTRVTALEGRLAAMTPPPPSGAPPVTAPPVGAPAGSSALDPDDDIPF